MGLCIRLSGRVQGVGFRPYIHRLAAQYALRGFVTNDSEGVLIEAEGTEENLHAFLKEIPEQKPANAVIASITARLLPQKLPYKDFFIDTSREEKAVNLPLTPDFALCPDCKKEMLDKNNRRYFYPFTTCTQCGPRYAITNRFPFDRANTSLAAWQMCPRCKKEYSDLHNRRHHSQTNSCPDCGITLTVADNKGKIYQGSNEEKFRFLAARVQEGKIVALKNISGYLLLCDATNNAAVKELRRRKHRPAKPLAVLFHDMAHINSYLRVGAAEQAMLESAVAPIVILPVKDKKDLSSGIIPPYMDSIGAMLPNSGLLFLLSQCLPIPLIATSGNIHGMPVCKDEKEAMLQLGKVADFFLHHDLPIVHAEDDSVLRYSGQYHLPIILRRARGFAPDSPVFSGKPYHIPQTLCLGSDLKNTITVVPNRYSYTSEYLGDLGNYDVFLRYANTIESYRELFSFEPRQIICDRHPAFEGKNIIPSLFPKTPLITIQHHQAHFAAILGEKQLWDTPGKILGVIWDGTGYGNEKEIYGGEFFTYGQGQIERVAHFSTYAWIAGDKMAKTPALSFFSLGNGNDRLHSYFSEQQWDIYQKMRLKASVKTTSVGRLFDGVAFLLGFRGSNSFEGEASMYLESKAQQYRNLHKNLSPQDYLASQPLQNTLRIDLLMDILLTQIEKEADTAMIAFNFHYTLVRCIEKTAKAQNCREIAFSGGVFQNALLVDLLLEYLQPAFRLYFHKTQSANDENISFGQLQHWLHIDQKK